MEGPSSSAEGASAAAAAGTTVAGTGPVPRCLPDVIVTMTSCKRLALFQKCMRSIAATWQMPPGASALPAVQAPRDPRVLEWVVVDDNSSPEDRAAMVWEFGARVTFVFKPPAAKGHVASMNLLLRRVKDSGATWWVHLEDDWEFVAARDYIGDGIACMQRYSHIHQVLFNINYVQTEEDGRVVQGDKPLDDAYTEHVYRPEWRECPYRNNHYWPHFSLQPSVIRVQALHAVPGDFTCTPTFFEMEYARKWAAAGHRSAFFRAVTCVHIGRQVKDSFLPGHDLNAYELNGVAQWDPPAAEGMQANTAVDTPFRVRVLTNFGTQQEAAVEFRRYVATGSRVHLVGDPREPYDYTVVVNFTREPVEAHRTVVYTLEPWCPADKHWGVHTWGPVWSRPDPTKFLAVFSHDRAANLVTWLTSWTWVDYTTRPIHKDPALAAALSMICSDKCYDPGHMQRLDLARAFAAEGSGVDFRFFGRGPPPPGLARVWVGPLCNFKDRELGLHPFRYCLMFESNREVNYVTEKLWEALLAETLCFYWGAPNVADIVDPRAVHVLDPEGTPETWAQEIKGAIAADAWSTALPYIRAAKAKVLQHHTFSHALQTLLEDDQWQFYPGVDSPDGDMGALLPVPVDKCAAHRRGAVAVNTLGFCKSRVTLPLVPTPWIHKGIAGSGIYVLKHPPPVR